LVTELELELAARSAAGMVSGLVPKWAAGWVAVSGVALELW